MSAADFGLFEIAKFLIKTGADLSEKDSSGETALIHAIHRKHHEVISILRKVGSTILTN